MFNKILLVSFAIIVGIMMSVAQADTRAGSRAEALGQGVTTENPAAEKKCLEAFVKSDFSYAYRLCRTLAQQGMRDAQLVTGLLYVFGRGTEKNHELARMWLQEASRNGSKEARQVLIDFNLVD